MTWGGVRKALGCVLVEVTCLRASQVLEGGGSVCPGKDPDGQGDGTTNEGSLLCGLNKLMAGVGPGGLWGYGAGFRTPSSPF